MKRTFALLLSAVMLLCLTACGKTETSSTETNPSTSATDEVSSSPETTATLPEETEPPITEELHTHNWKNATCTTPKTCIDCQTTEGRATGHSWKNATCVAPKTCSVCNTTEGSAISHNWIDATCTTPKTCSVCNTTEGSAIGHNWIDATCTTPKTCSVCNTTEGDANGHAPGDWIIEQESTCTTNGSKYTVCSICNETVNTEVIAAEHKLNEWIVDTEATCDQAGLKIQTCSVCEETVHAEEIPAAGHDYNKTLIEATETTGASLTLECQKCNHSYNEEIPPIGNIRHTQTGMSSVVGPFGSYVSKSFTIYASGGYGTLQYKFTSGSSVVADFSTSNSITVKGSGLLTVTIKDEAGQTETYSFYI